MVAGYRRHSESELLEKSSALDRKGCDAESERLLRFAVERFPSNPSFTIRLAVALFERSPRESVDLLYRAVELAPEDPRVLTRAASLLFYHKEFASSFEYTQRAMRIAESTTGEPDYVGYLLHIAGRHASLRGQDEIAENALRTAFEEDSAISERGRILADFYASRERPAEALEVIDEALRVRGKDASLLRTREKILAHFPEVAP